MEAKLFDSELKVMEVLWREGDSTAKRIAQVLGDEVVQQAHTEALIHRVYDGSTDKLFAALLSRTKLPPEEIKNLKSIVDNLE